MMLPTFVPTLRAFLNLGATPWGDGRHTAHRYAGAGRGRCAGLGRRCGPWRAGTSPSHWQTVALLLAAGLYQFTHFKAACLAKCRLPLIFFVEGGALGPCRAMHAGAELGLLRFGCSWALMALAYVGGTMNLVGMGAATLFMALGSWRWKNTPTSAAR